MTPMNDDAIRELLALEAVGALSDDERAALDSAIEDRPDLRAELESLRGAAATMAEAVTESPPPPLRARVLETIAATPQETPLPSQPAVTPTVPAEPEAEPEEPLAPVVPITAARRRRWLGVGAAVAAAAAIVVGVLIVSPFGGDDVGDQIADVIEDPNARRIPLEGELSGLQIVYSADEGASVLEGNAITAPEGDNVLELWRIAGPTPEPIIREFRPNDDGSVAQLLEGLDPGEDVFAVTVEPAGGSDQPTTEPVAITPEV